jgi:hypothetical protein
MTEATQILAILVVITHLGVIFWPRKPLQISTDKTGMPIIWQNNSEERQDVACIWQEAVEVSATPHVDPDRTSRRA